MRNCTTLIFFLMLVAAQPAFAQSRSYQEELYELYSASPDSTKTKMKAAFAGGKPYQVRSSLPPALFGKTLNEQFTTLVTGQARNSIGNFAALDLKEPAVSFAGSSVINNAAVFTLTANGGITDGFFSLFNNSKLNTKVIADARLHLLNHRSNKLSYRQTMLQEYEAKRKAIYDKAALQLIATQYFRTAATLQKNRAKLQAEQSRVDSLLATNPAADVRQSLQYDSAVIAFQMQNITDSLNNYSAAKEQYEITQKRNADIAALKPDIQLTGFSIGWLSIGYKVRNDAFRLFNAKFAPADQLQKQSFVSHEAILQYSHYNWTTQKSGTNFWLLGAGFSHRNNLDDLTNTEITQVTTYTPAPQQRTATTKYNVYEGEYKKNLKGLRAFGDYYWFVFSNSMALHGFGEAVYKTELKPIYNLGFGFLMSYRNVKDNSADVNAEVYYKLADLTNNTATDLKLFERNEIGLRFTFPITFKNRQ